MNAEKSLKLSPLVKFGPEGLCFEKPVEIRIPQFGGPEEPGYKMSRQNSSASVLLSNQKQANWTQVPINNSAGAIDSNGVQIVAINVHHF